MRLESFKKWFLNPNLSPPSGCHPPTFCDRLSEDSKDNKAQDMTAEKSRFTGVASTCTLISASTDSGCQRQTYSWGSTPANISAKGILAGIIRFFAAD